MRRKKIFKEKNPPLEKIKLEHNPTWALQRSNNHVTETKTQHRSVSLPSLPSCPPCHPYYFEKVGVVLRVESNPSWRIIKGAAPALVLGELRRNRQLWVSVRYSGCSAFIPSKALNESQTEQRSTGSEVCVWSCREISRFVCQVQKQQHLLEYKAMGWWLQFICFRTNPIATRFHEVWRE